MKTNLEKFYNQEFSGANFPKFAQLNPQQIKKLENSLSFASWQLEKAFYHFLKVSKNYYKDPNEKKIFEL
jgi:hypothetical protein